MASIVAKVNCISTTARLMDVGSVNNESSS